MKKYASLFLIGFALASCKSSGDKEKLFTIRHGDELGIDFVNSIATSDSVNALSFEYIYNGSGVGVGDFDNDGLADLFFGGNQVSSRLYLNKGDLKFEEVTEKAGVTTNRWITGVSVVDINQDGWMDIFLAVAGKTSPENMRDLLFINQGLTDGAPVFKESAKAYGIDDDGYGTMGAFFDYDKDGDLDLYLVRNALESFNRNNLRAKRINGEASSTDQLYRNNGNNTFENVSREAGILIEGYGLGVNISDLNHDSWPDVYVSNDFMSNDLIWINQQDGTFKNVAGDYLKHQTHNGMGVDIADFNNDALTDIVVVDMLPPGHKRQKMMTPGQNYDHFHMSEQMGYQPQYMRNTLQLNRGKFDDGNVRFSEIAFMAGVSATDWSWAPLFADFDNDGWKDLFIANGYRKDVTDLDFIFFGLNDGNPFGTPEARSKRFNTELDKLPEVKLNNYVFRNTGSLVFEDKTAAWGTDLETFSNGAAYADLDNDGDLDLITNNIDQEVIVYENQLNAWADKHHFLMLQSTDTGVLNQKVWVYAHGQQQYQELTPYRGFQSTVTSNAHFGLGTADAVDSIVILWPDMKRLVYRNIQADTVIRFSQRDADGIANEKLLGTDDNFMFKKVDKITFVHRESSPSDIKVTRTLMHELSRFGPCIASGDINGDQLDDFFVGAEKGSSSRLFIQRANGEFRAVIIETDTLQEDGDALFFDSDNDGDADLYVASSCATSQEKAGRHRLYINDGNGNFNKTDSALPDVTISASCVVNADYDGDGDQDLFIGGRLDPGQYPLHPRSAVYRNDGGKFTDVTEQLNSALRQPGMVTSALWADIDNDKRPDLILAGEWMPIRVFLNTTAGFKEGTESLGLQGSDGWWNCLQAGDFNGDGFIDIVAGNTGKNSYFQPTAEYPVKVIAKDFDKNGSIDPVVTYYNPVEKDRFVVHNRMVLIDQIPGVKRRIEKFLQYATTPYDKLFTAEEIEGAYEANAYMLASKLLINQKGNKFELRDLPETAQVSTLNDMIIDDLNGDGHLDIIAIGNNYSQETLFGRFNASLGTILLGDGAFGWRSPEPVHSGFLVDGNAKYITSLDIPGRKKAFVITNNNDSLDYYVIEPLAPQIAIQR
ncbi:MAG TPA: VCBS repeat-containing protein [Ohtaekwangia sp.]|nr:VCBS repeat-containing protein [Ohtaekwangia sp.]